MAEVLPGLEQAPHTAPPVETVDAAPLVIGESPVHEQPVADGGAVPTEVVQPLVALEVDGEPGESHADKQADLSHTLTMRGLKSEEDLGKAAQELATLRAA
jgi:hypothetical protein